MLKINKISFPPEDYKPHLLLNTEISFVDTAPCCCSAGQADTECDLPPQQGQGHPLCSQGLLLLSRRAASSSAQLDINACTKEAPWLDVQG